MTIIQYKIPNISCAHCVHTIKTEVGDLPGVQSVEGEVDSQRVVISFDPPATEEQIMSLLAEIDYAPATG